MKSLANLRKQDMKRTMTFQGSPNRRVSTTSDRSTLSFLQIEKLPDATTTSYQQNPNGTWPTLTGYDW